MVKSKVGMQVEEILNDYNNRDLIEEQIRLLGFTEYLYPKYKRKTRWPDDVEFYFYKNHLLIIDWIQCHYELYNLEVEGDT